MKASAIASSPPGPGWDLTAAFGDPLMFCVLPYVAFSVGQKHLLLSQIRSMLHIFPVAPSHQRRALPLIVSSDLLPHVYNRLVFVFLALRKRVLLVVVA